MRTAPNGTARSLREATLDSVREIILASEHVRSEVAGATGLAMSDLTALSYLGVGPLGPSELAAAVGITSSSATALVDRLERGGYVNRTRHARDRRRFVVELTAHGEQLVTGVRALFDQALDKIPAERLATIDDALTTLARAMRSIEASLENGSTPV